MTVAMTLFRITVVLAAAVTLLPLLRRQSAAVRAWVLTAALACAALLPLLQLVAPAWGSPFTGTAVLPAADEWSQALLGIWVAGAAAHLLILTAGIVRLTGVAAAADPIREGRCADLALDIAADYRVHAPVLLLQAERPTLPVTWGHVQPKILLPPDAHAWSDERMRAVLCHEMAHVRRRDWAVQVLAMIVRALCWPHPLVWLVCWRLRLECERAADDAVLRGGITGSRYASHLLDLARGLLHHRHPASVSGLALKSTLERRVRSMLVSRCDRGPLGRAVAGAVALLMLAVSVSIAGYGGAVEPTVAFSAPPARRLTLLLDGRIVDLSKEWPTYPNPRAGLVEGPGFPRGF